MLAHLLRFVPRSTRLASPAAGLSPQSFGFLVVFQVVVEGGDIGSGLSVAATTGTASPSAAGRAAAVVIVWAFVNRCGFFGHPGTERNRRLDVQRIGVILLRLTIVRGTTAGITTSYPFTPSAPAAPATTAASRFVSIIPVIVRLPGTTARRRRLVVIELGCIIQLDRIVGVDGVDFVQLHSLTLAPSAAAPRRPFVIVAHPAGWFSALA